ncbi:MAG TPA: nitrile hydratase accessory protein [Myxococcota bacterium]|nr:nitrile hydratase accessory protein [Myxococcota bacterium]
MSGDPLAALGTKAPPRKNGELHFDEAWESRVFGLTMSLHEAGAFAWGEFQAELIASIGAWERAHASEARSEAKPSEVEQWPRSGEGGSAGAGRAAPLPTSGAGFHYWAYWLEAFERLAARKGLLELAALDARAAELAARPAGWDHARV